MGMAGGGRETMKQEHKEYLETENPTLCHLSDECSPTKLGMYNEIHFYWCAIYSWPVCPHCSFSSCPKPCLVEYE